MRISDWSSDVCSSDLARITSNKPEGIEIDGIIIPRKCVGEVMKIVDEVEGNVGIELSAAKIRFTLGNVIITSKVIDGTFPDYKRIIPTATDRSEEHTSELQSLMSNSFAVFGL